MMRTDQMAKVYYHQVNGVLSLKPIFPLMVTQFLVKPDALVLDKVWTFGVMLSAIMRSLLFS